MADEKPENQPTPEQQSEGAAGDAPPSTPFDNPYFLPGLLFLLALWFGYDGWFNPEMEWVNFNRYGFGVLMLGAIYFTLQNVRDARRARDGD